MGDPFLYNTARSFVQTLRGLGASLEASAIRNATKDFPAGKQDEGPSYSQYGEDRLLLRMFAGKSTGTALEVGGFDGVTFSNTLLFEELGWRTMIVEPMPEFARKIRARRRAELFECAAGASAGTAAFTVAKGAESLSTLHPTGAQLRNMQHHSAAFERTEVSVRTLDEMLQSASVEGLDFVTIDVEGHEVEALRGFTLARWKPRIVLVEDGSMGTDLAVRKEMRRQRYRRFMTTGCNDWYAPESDQRLMTRRIVWCDRLRVGYCRSMAVIESFASRRSESAA